MNSKSLYAMNTCCGVGQKARLQQSARSDDQNIHISLLRRAILLHVAQKPKTTTQIGHVVLHHCPSMAQAQHHT